MSKARWWIGAGLSVLALIAADFTGYDFLKKKPEPQIAGVEKFDITDRTHTSNPVTYPQSPPAGGPHARIWQTCGIYSQPIANENAVHSMEHGAVWITYQPNLPPRQVQHLQQLVRSQKLDHTLLSPYAAQSAPVVITAWGRQLRLADATDPRLTAFLDLYQMGPQTPERGAPCDHGTGQPDQ